MTAAKIGRPRALDLCCRAGGASVGLYRAGFDVVGVDRVYSKNYPFPVIVHDALDIESVLDVSAFDFIWASPPCQEHSKARGNAPTKHACIIAPMREILRRSSRPYVIENVEAAPIRADVILTGDMFGLNTYRKRHFETGGFLCLAPAPPGPRFGPETRPGSVTVAGGGNADFAACCEAMEIDWMTRRELSQAVPPAYAEYIARQAANAICGGERARELRRPDFRPGRVSAAWDGSLGQAKSGQLIEADFA